MQTAWLLGDTIQCTTHKDPPPSIDVHTEEPCRSPHRNATRRKPQDPLMSSLAFDYGIAGEQSGRTPSSADEEEEIRSLSWSGKRRASWGRGAPGALDPCSRLGPLSLSGDPLIHLRYLTYLVPFILDLASEESLLCHTPYGFDHSARTTGFLLTSEPILPWVLCGPDGV